MSRSLDRIDGIELPYDADQVSDRDDRHLVANQAKLSQDVFFRLGVE
ncbi:hypothetical protein [Pelagibacterium sp.]